jgi:hypothetical protein
MLVAVQKSFWAEALATRKILEDSTVVVTVLTGQERVRSRLSMSTTRSGRSWLGNFLISIDSVVVHTALVREDDQTQAQDIR